MTTRYIIRAQGDTVPIPHRREILRFALRMLAPAVHDHRRHAYSRDIAHIYYAHSALRRLMIAYPSQTMPRIDSRRVIYSIAADLRYEAR